MSTDTVVLNLGTVGCADIINRILISISPIQSLYVIGLHLAYLRYLFCISFHYITSFPMLSLICISQFQVRISIPIKGNIHMQWWYVFQHVSSLYDLLNKGWNLKLDFRLGICDAKSTWKLQAFNLSNITLSISGLSLFWISFEFP